MWDNIKHIQSSDANVSKFVFTTSNAVVESVLYKYPTYEDRTVICCSTQSGCPVGCRFCGAGDYFVRSMTAAEIVAQPVHLIEHTGIPATDIKKLQIMFMSMGEPMHNWKELKKALVILHKMYPHARLLISTSAPKVSTASYDELIELAKIIPTIGLQFSAHESTDEARAKLIPTPTLPLATMAAIGESFLLNTGRKPFFNYCVHDKNNTLADVLRLQSIFKPFIFEATLSVICERDEHVAAANERQRQLAEDFSNMMLKVGYGVRVFNPAGQDTIGGGCGQLWYVQDWMKEHASLAKPSRGCGLPVVHTPRPTV